jgi:hypothetical protein
MEKFRKALGGAPTNPLSGTVRCDQVGVFLLQLSHPLNHFVILAVGNLWFFLKVIELIVPANLFAQVVDFLFD